MSKAHFGLIGLGVMGENLVLNAERNGFSSVVYNRTYSKTEEFMSGRGAGKNIQAATNLQDFVDKLERPRRILMMVKAGEPVDAVIQQISPYLDEGDLLIDGKSHCRLMASIETFSAIPVVSTSNGHRLPLAGKGNGGDRVH